MKGPNNKQVQHDISKVFLRNSTEARRQILAVLRANGGGTAQTFRDLGISRRYLRTLMERLDLLEENEQIKKYFRLRFRLPSLDMRDIDKTNERVSASIDEGE